MNANPDRTTEASLGTDFARLFRLDVDQFQLLGHTPRFNRECDYLNAPYELSDLMHQAIAAGMWPRQS